MFTGKKDSDGILNLLNEIELYLKGDTNTCCMNEELNIKDKNMKKIYQKLNEMSNFMKNKDLNELKVYDETMLVCEKLSDGYTDSKINLQSEDSKLNYISHTINEAISNIELSLNKVITVLKEYENNDYRSNIDLDVFRGGQFKELLEGINSLQKRITSRVLQSYKIGITMEHQSDILQK
jgi:methyl-accepting chemotaxis protein